MSRPTVSLRATSRFYPDPADMGRDRRRPKPRMLEIVPMNDDFPIERGSERADRLVPPEVADHYLRQGERLADLIMAMHTFMRRLTGLFRSRSDGRTREPATR